MTEVVEMTTLNPKAAAETETVAPPTLATLSQLHCPSMTRTPFLTETSPATRRPLVLLFMMDTPITSPVKKAFAHMQCYFEDVAHFTKLNPQALDNWLPITESRNGNTLYAAYHLLNSGIGVQALVLPFAFASLSWVWGTLCLMLVFAWQLYTIWLLIQLHESRSGKRYSRYLPLSMEAFGEKVGKLLTLFPLMYLSGGTCVTLIMIGADSMKTVFQIVCQDKCNLSPLATLEWYIVFSCSATLLAQLPNLNSIAGASLVGSFSAVGYCTLIWVLSLIKGRPPGVSYYPYEATKTQVSARVFSTLNALGIIAFAFRGHNLVLEIQGTMPFSGTHPSSLPMWRGAKFAYAVIGLCLFPLAIGGYWAYGNKIPDDGGMLNALYKYHEKDISHVLLATTSLLVVISCLSSFQIYAMPAFDNLEFTYTRRTNKPCPRWLRFGFRLFFGCLTFFIAVALPFLPSLAGLIGGVSLPITLAYPCFMWISLRAPRKYSSSWFLNWVLGILGMVLSISVVTGAVWSIVTCGIEIHFFKPQ